MHISWKSVKGADAYYIYRKTGNGSWQRIGTTNKGTAVSYTDGSAVGGVTYSYCLLYTSRCVEETGQDQAIFTIVI